MMGREEGGVSSDLQGYLVRRVNEVAEARRQYAALPPEAKGWSNADLDADLDACPSRLDFARLLREVDRHLA
jgi:hypothetical protein